ncbi:Protein SRI-19 a, partial [Aphelenchoides avenae]
ICSWSFDIFTAVMLGPYSLLPIAGYCTIGLLRFTGHFWGGIIGFCVMLWFLGLCGASVLTAAVYRLAAIHNWQYRLLNTKGIVVIIAFHLFIAGPVLFVAAFVVAGISGQQEKLMTSIVKAYPGVRAMVASEICVFSPLEANTAMTVAAIVALLTLAFVILFGGGTFAFTIVALWQRRKTMSQRSFRLHRQLVQSLALQFAIPGLTLLLPFCVVAVCLVTKSDALKRVWPFAAQAVSSHSLLNAFIMIVCTKPYREAVYELTGLKKLVTKVGYKHAVTSFGTPSFITVQTRSPTFRG